MENRLCLKVTTHFSCSSHQFNRSTCRRSRHNRPCGHSHSRARPPSCRSRIRHVRSHHNRPCGHSRARHRPPSSRGGSSLRQRRERHRQGSHRRRGQHTHGHKRRGRHKHGRARRGEQRSRGILRRRERRPPARHQQTSCRIRHVRSHHSRGLRNLHGRSHHSRPQPRPPS